MSSKDNKYACEEQSMELDLSEPNEDLVNYARENLGETEDSKACALQELRDMIYETGEVTPHRMDDLFLMRFLRARYFRVERAHELMVRYYKFKIDNVGIQEGLSHFNENFEHICNDEIISVLPYRDHLGRRTMIYRLGNWNTSLYGVEKIFQATLLLLEMAILEQRAQIVGGVCFFDMENLSLQQAWQVTPSVASKILQLMGMSFPIRIREIHIMNQPWVFEMIYAIFKPMLDSKMKSKIHFHGSNFETLHTFIDPKNLPLRYGGTREDFNNSDWIKTVDSNPKIIEELVSLGYNCDASEVYKKNNTSILSKDLDESQSSESIIKA